LKVRIAGELYHRWLRKSDTAIFLMTILAPRMMLQIFAKLPVEAGMSMEL
jgi:hypothetical protein